VKTLLDFPPGTLLRISGLSAALPPELRGHLSAWGLFPGTRVTLLGHRPVTRLAVEHAELALEREVAAVILAEAIDALTTPAPQNAADAAPATESARSATHDEAQDKTKTRRHAA